jgi:hypothetical protein
MTRGEWLRLLASRLWHRIDVRGEDDCWLWTGARTSAGYGHLKRPHERRTILAHRAAYEVAHGLIPEHLEIDHTCDAPLCCNPAHLEAVSHGVNLTRASGKRTTCPGGHPLDGQRRQHDPDGTARIARYCKTCNNERGRRQRAARSAEER